MLFNVDESRGCSNKTRYIERLAKALGLFKLIFEEEEKKKENRGHDVRAERNSAKSS